MHLTVKLNISQKYPKNEEGESPILGKGKNETKPEGWNTQQHKSEHISIPPKATFQFVKSQLEEKLLVKQCVHMISQEQLYCRIMFIYLRVYFHENLIPVLSVGLSWLSALITLLWIQVVAAHYFQYVCCFVRCMLSILRSTAVIKEQNFNLLSSSHVDMGTFYLSAVKSPPHVSYWLPGIIITGITYKYTVK